MVKYGFLEPAKYDTLKTQDIELDYNVENHNVGLAPYFRTEASKFLRQWGRENGYDLYGDGLRIAFAPSRLNSTSLAPPLDPPIA